MTEGKDMPGWAKGLLFVLALAVLVAAVLVIIKYAPRPPREMLDADAGTPVRIEVHELRSGNDAVIEDPETAETVAAAFRGHTFRRNGGTYGMQGYTLHFFFEDGSENVIEMQWETSLKLGNYSYIPADGADYSAVWSLLTGLFAADDREIESVTVQELYVSPTREASTSDPEIIDKFLREINAARMSDIEESAGGNDSVFTIKFRYTDGWERPFLLSVSGLLNLGSGEHYPLNAEQQRARGEAVDAVLAALDTPTPEETVRTYYLAQEDDGWERYDSLRWSSLVEYTAETREALRYPVGVAEGARDSAAGELIWPADGDFAVEYRDGAAYLTREGGDAWTVKPEDVVGLRDAQGTGDERRRGPAALNGRRGAEGEPQRTEVSIAPAEALRGEHALGVERGSAAR